MPSNKKSSKSKAKAANRNLNNETVVVLKRLLSAIKELDNKGKNQTITPPNVAIPINHYRDITPELEGAYKMLEDGANLIKNVSTKYTLLGKINVEDGSKYTTELRQASELISTSAFLVHQPNVGCALATRTVIKQKCSSILNSVIALVESFVSLKALDGNVGAQLTGAVWSACDQVLENFPKGNRTCMRREMFTWVRDCNDTMEEFQELIDLSTNGEDDTESEVNDEDQYSSKELDVAKASLALIKCSRGIINLSMKASECAGAELSELEKKLQSEDHSDDEESKKVIKMRKLSNLQWINNLHETCRLVGEGMTNLGCVMYPPLNVSDAVEWTDTEIGAQASEQTKCLLEAAHMIDNPILGDDPKTIVMNDEVKEMCSKLISAIEHRSKEVQEGIKTLL
ncbi:hypothetical protein CTEN210_07615 [Chaetoceros tenuissimus]|uniref:Cyclin-D1-binding protein 1-like N-terminal domain-containing protein n=1 Tax=Chaetoceros tenuissimus TaxID=426638 RepID=A0AAD3H5Y2_9STRA|nr:hypothetical protein CTEN210_07615 [Chaetoceros tenuissimus]